MFFQFKYLIPLLVGILSQTASGQQHITSATLIKATAEGLPHCLHYRVIGSCFWWVKDGFAGHPEVTLKVAHYVPDVVVSVFNNANDNPLLESHLTDKAAYAIAQKAITWLAHQPLDGGRHSLASPHENGVYFKEVTIMGNPAAYLVAESIGKDLTIKPIAKPYLLYFSSLFDVLSWRSGLESLNPKAWTPQHLIGPTTHAWGNVYPRDGFVVAPNDSIAASVIAQRAADIITQSHSLHVYHRLKNRCGSHCHAAKVKENSKKIQWQRVYPRLSHRCIVFGKKPSGQGDDKLARQTKGRYVWLLWRRYEGCIQPTGGGTYIKLPWTH